MKNEVIYPYGKHLIEDDDIAAVVRTLRSGILTGGPMVGKFEEALKLATSAPYAVACSSGTAALHLATHVLDLRGGDTVIVPSITFLATANAIRFCTPGTYIIFADVDPDTGLMTEETLEAALKIKSGSPLGEITLSPVGDIKAVFPVHFAGQCVDMQAINKIARKHGMKIVEDACHAIGGRTNGQPVGSCIFSDLTTFSFHPVKTVAMGEGGAVTTRDEFIARRLRDLRNHGMIRDPSRFEFKDRGFTNGEPNPWYYEMQELGFNYRVSDIHCALGLSQISKLDRFVAERRKIMGWYDAFLAPLHPIVKSISRAVHCDPAWHINVVLIDFKVAETTRGKVMRALSKMGVGSQVHYIPVHQQPYYRRQYFSNIKLPGADAFYEKALSLPLYVGLTKDDVAKIVSALAAALGRRMICE